MAQSPRSVVHVVRTVDPQDGGPPLVAMATTAAQKRAGLDPRIVCMDQPDPDGRVGTFARSALGDSFNALTRLRLRGGRAWPLWIRSDRQLRHCIAQAEVVHMHGLWNPMNLAAARFARQLNKPYIVRPAGMLEPWAYHHRGAHKRLAMALVYRKMLEQAGAVHATAQQEADHLRDLGLKMPIAVVPNGLDPAPYAAPIDLAPLYERWPQLREGRLVLFLSRVQKKKGLLMLADAWASLKDRFADWQLVIAGPQEDDHWNEVSNRLNELGAQERVTYVGPVFGEDKIRLYQAAELFVLPTHSENFGVVIAEALAAGLAVITTQGTPWRSLVEQDCGWWTSIDTPAITAAMEQAMTMDPPQRRAMGQRGRQMVIDQFSWQAIAEQLDALYAWLLGAGQKPPFVQLR